MNEIDDANRKLIQDTLFPDISGLNISDEKLIEYAGIYAEKARVEISANQKFIDDNFPLKRTRSQPAEEKVLSESEKLFESLPMKSKQEIQKIEQAKTNLEMNLKILDTINKRIMNMTVEMRQKIEKENTLAPQIIELVLSKQQDPKIDEFRCLEEQIQALKTERKRKKTEKGTVITNLKTSKNVLSRLVKKQTGDDAGTLTVDDAGTLIKAAEERIAEIQNGEITVTKKTAIRATA